MFIRGIKIGYGTNSSSYHNTIIIGNKERRKLKRREEILYAVSIEGEVDFYKRIHIFSPEKNYPKYGKEFFNKPDWRKVEKALIVFDNYEDFFDLKKEYEYGYDYNSDFDEITYITETGEKIHIYCSYGRDS